MTIPIRIFLLALTRPLLGLALGARLRHVSLGSCLGLCLIGSLACDRKPAPHGDHAEEKHGDAHGGEKHGDAHAEQEGDRISVKDLRGIRFVAVPEPKAEGAWYPAEAVSDESAQALLTSPVKGIVSAILVPPGRAVAGGTALLSLQSPELARLKADWVGAKARRERADGEQAREQRLFAASAGSRRELEAAQSDAATAQAEEEAAKLALTARGVTPESAGAVFTVKAPKGGSVSGYKVLLGQGVEAGQELGGFQTAHAALAKVELPLPAPEAWKAGSPAELRASNGQRWKARVEGIPMGLTQDTRRLTYRLRLEGGSLPLAGTPLEVRVPLARGVVLPQGALQQIEGIWGVFVKEGEEAAFRPVRRGAELGGDVLVLEGLKPGETVVGEGAYLLKSLLLKRKSGGEGHDH